MPRKRIDDGRLSRVHRAGQKELVITEIRRTGGHVSQMAWALSVARPQLYRWLKRWDLWELMNESRRERLEKRGKWAEVVVTNGSTFASAPSSVAHRGGF